MSTDKIKVEIVTPVHNRKELTLQFLRSIKKLNSEGLDIHTIIVDDGSSDGTSEAINNEFSDVEVIKGDGNLWFTEGTNVGVRAALKHNPKYVLMVNDDQVFDSDAVKYLIETAEKYPRSIIGSLLLLWDTPHKLFQVSPKWDTMHGGWRHWVKQTIWTIPDKAWEIDLIVGNCVLIPRKAIDENGLMDSSRYPNFGDGEYTPRMKRKGWKLLIEPKARVFCQPNNIPSKVVKMSLKEKFNALFIDLGNIHNLRRKLYFYLDSAPTKMQGAAGYFMFYLRLLTGKNIEGDWAYQQEEKPLTEIFSDRIVKN